MRDGKIVGQLSSGNYGHALGGAIGLGYVPCRQPDESAESMLASSYAIEVAGKTYGAVASIAPMYDPKSDRIKQ